MSSGASKRSIYSIIKRAGQSGLVIFNVFFGPMPVPVQLSVWPRTIIALSIVAALPLIALRRRSKWRWWITGFALLSCLIGVACGFAYWLKLPTISMSVRGATYVTAAPTAETLKQLRKYNLQPNVTDTRRLIEGQANREVESFFDSAGLTSNKLFLSILYVFFLAPVTIGIVIFMEWIPD
jgi:hypothetical protein